MYVLATSLGKKCRYIRLLFTYTSKHQVLFMRCSEHKNALVPSKVICLPRKFIKSGHGNIECLYNHAH